ncbi:hypothetical protein B0J11DRAFT_508382 [Dendryphion nanum]|uniref:Uncharacterized protein n=1 Tax=Dendryphion nanum TaxID=256645 RepID=A0A9P9DI41_9PLEO|nr:hypothetical protein B0J11DRAFT_508382 [Dendryphion nanum]
MFFEAKNGDESSLSVNTDLFWLFFCIFCTLGIGVVQFIMDVLHDNRFLARDNFIVSGYTVYVGSALSWHFVVLVGLGRHAPAFEKKDENSSNFTLMALANLTLSSLLARVLPQFQKQTTAIIGIIATWIAYIVFTFIFQCSSQISEPIDTTACRKSYRLVPVALLGMVTDLVMAGWTIPNIHLSDRTLILTFGARAVLPVVASADMWYGSNASTRFNARYRSGFSLFSSVWTIQGHRFSYSVLNHWIFSFSLVVASVHQIKRLLSKDDRVRFGQIKELVVVLPL